VSSPVKVLQNIIRKQISGRLTLENLQGDGDLWQLHIGKGQLHYGSSVKGGRERLIYILQRHAPAWVAQVPDRLEEGEYSWLMNLWHRGVLPLGELRLVLQALSQEAMTHILSVRQAGFHFDRNIGLSSILISEDFKSLITPIAHQVRDWQLLQPNIISPLHRVNLKGDGNLSPQALALFEQLCPLPPGVFLPVLLNQSLCLYELATVLRSDTLTVAQALQPLIQSQGIELHPYHWLQQASCPTVACIDDSNTVQRNVKLLLEAAGCRVIPITEPLTALSSLGRDAPDLILLDINMPDLDGYTLCRMLRQCTALKETPIVMLTGRDTLVDKVKARLLGASDYLTKPFSPPQLVDIIQKYISLEVSR